MTFEPNICIMIGIFLLLILCTISFFESFDDEDELFDQSTPMTGTNQVLFENMEMNGRFDMEGLGQRNWKVDKDPIILIKHINEKISV